MIGCKLSLAGIFFAFQIAAFSQPYQLTVVNGYGSGFFSQGDTVHIWSRERTSTEVFQNWSGRTDLLNSPNEWHTTLIMPGTNVSIQANFKGTSITTIQMEQFRGKNNFKNVYHNFPKDHIGVIYFFHGTGGRADGWINNVENRQLVDDALSRNFAVIITDSEETGTGVDYDNDGKLRWEPFPLDVINNVDYANLIAITDTFLQRGVMLTQTPRYSIGMSNGGAFSAACSFFLNFNAGISYCASAAPAIFQNSEVPFQFNMAQDDSHPEVGPEGNLDAYNNAQVLENRGVCNDYNLHSPSPLYPERFKRIPGVTLVKSQNVFNDIEKEDFLDGKKFIKVSLDTILQRYIASPLSFPGLNALTNAQRIEVFNQLGAVAADHQFYSDYNSKALNFLIDPCNLNNPNSIQTSESSPIHIFPNPVRNQLQLNGLEMPASVEIIDVLGRLQVVKISDTQIDVSLLEPGKYMLIIKSSKIQKIATFIKL